MVTSSVAEGTGQPDVACMLLLHLSDLHFRAGVVGTAMDPDAHLRSELLLDAQRMTSKLAVPDAVLVTGDLAFAGEAIEYEFARNWLTDLCTKCGTNQSSVFTCPGNHDVVRAIAARPTIQALHRDIKQASEASRDALLRGLLTDAEAQRLLYESIGPYNLFAAQFLCDLLPPERTIARRDLILNDGSTLRLSGLNSTFVSSASDQAGQLFVDPAARQVSREAGVEHLVMCHHPPNWLGQGDLLHDHLNSVARLQLFGHEHRDRIELGRDWVRIFAGAAHPEHGEKNWEPGYNLIELSVRGEGLDRHLDVRVHVRVWQQRPDQFRAKTDRNNEEFFATTLALQPWHQATPVGPTGVQVDQPAFVAGDPPPKGDSMAQLRELAVRFFGLSLSEKSAIAGKLNLMEEEDANQPDFERFRRALMRARDRDLIDELEREIRLAETQRKA
jgi:hypothetical protein